MTHDSSRALNLTRTLLAPAPSNDVAGRALNALRAGRVTDAEKLTHLLPTVAPLDPAWKQYIEARIALEQGEFAAAKEISSKAASLAMRLGLSDPEDRTAIRLSGAAMELAGVALRRQDQPVEAGRLHRAAFALRRDYGTPDEQSESALSLGLCAEWSTDLCAAEHWYRRSLVVDAVEKEQAQRKSSALIRLSTLLSRLSRHDEALDAAGNAAGLLRECCPGDIAAISAGLYVTLATIRRSEDLVAENADAARSYLDETSHRLTPIREDLLAFGQLAHLELAWCDEQAQFVETLRLAIETPC